MFLNPSINDLDFEISTSGFDWIKIIEILRTSFLDIHPSILEEVKKYLPDNISSIERKLILNGGRGLLKTNGFEKTLKYAKLTNKKTILILSTFNQVHTRVAMVKKYLNISKNDININFGANPKCDNATFSRVPLLDYRVYITDINGINRMVSDEFFSGKMFGNKIDFMIVDKLFQTVLMVSDAIFKEIYSIVFIDDVYLSHNYESMKCLDIIAWTEEQQFALKEISKLHRTMDYSMDSNVIKILKEVDFILE